MADKRNTDKKSLLEDSNAMTRGEFLRRVMLAVPALLLPPLLLEQVGCLKHIKVDRGISFEITFSKQMDRNSVINNLSIVPAPDESPAFTWKENDSVLYAESPVFKKGVLFTVTIGAGACDSEGIALDGNSDGVAGDPYVFTLQSA